MDIEKKESKVSGKIPELLPFSMDSQSGWLFLSRDVDVTRKEAKRIYSLFIRATDPEGLFVHTRVVVRSLNDVTRAYKKIDNRISLTLTHPVI